MFGGGPKKQIWKDVSKGSPFVAIVSQWMVDYYGCTLLALAIGAPFPAEAWYLLIFIKPLKTN